MYLNSSYSNSYCRKAARIINVLKMFLISRHWYVHLQYMKKLRRYVRKNPINDGRMHWIDNSCYQKLVYIDFDLRSLKMFLYTLNLFVFLNAIFKVYFSSKQTVYNVNLTIRKRIIIALWEETRVKHLMSDVTTHI